MKDVIREGVDQAASNQGAAVTQGASTTRRGARTCTDTPDSSLLHDRDGMTWWPRSLTPRKLVCQSLLSSSASHQTVICQSLLSSHIIQPGPRWEDSWTGLLGRPDRRTGTRGPPQGAGLDMVDREQQVSADSRVTVPTVTFYLL